MRPLSGSRYPITRFRSGRFSLSLLILGAVFSAASVCSAAAAEIVILHTNSVTGHLFGCPT